MSEKETVENLVILNNIYKTNPIEARRLGRQIIDNNANSVSYAALDTATSENNVAL